MNKRLERIPAESVLGGVAAGLADYFNIDKIIVRLLFVAGLFLGGSTLLIYIILWIVLPERVGTAYTVYGPSETVSSTEPYTSMTDPNQRREDERRGGYVGGAILILLGVIFLLREFGFRIDWDWVWPVGMIGLGIWLLVRNRPANRVDDSYTTTDYNSPSTTYTPPTPPTPTGSTPETPNNPQQPL